MITKLDRLVGEVRARAEAEAEAEVQRQRKEQEATIRQEMKRFRAALEHDLGKELFQALLEAGAIEAWVRVLRPWDYEVFAFQQPRKHDKLWRVCVVLAFTYGECRFHLRYRAPEQLTLARVEVRGHVCYVLDERSVWTTARQDLLGMIYELASNHDAEMIRKAS